MICAFGEVDLETPPVKQETMALSFVPLFPSGTVCRSSKLMNLL